MQIFPSRNNDSDFKVLLMGLYGSIHLEYYMKGKRKILDIKSDTGHSLENEVDCLHDTSRIFSLKLK